LERGVDFVSSKFAVEGFERGLLVAIALYEHEVGPGFGVGGLVAFPGEAGGGVAGVGGAGVGVGRGGFFEGVDDGGANHVDAAEVWRDEVGPGAGEGVEPADVPGAGGGVEGADVDAEDDEFAGEGGHAVLVGDGVAVEDEAAEPLGVEALPFACGGFDAGIALPTADEEGEGCELGRRVGGELAEVGLTRRHEGLGEYGW